MALVTIIFFGIILFSLLLGYAIFFKQSSKLMIIGLLFILIFLILIGLTTYQSITDLSKVEDFQKLGPYGDYIGGILNPLIAVFGVFAAGFAFYAQYQANKQVQEQFEDQKKKDNQDYIYNKFNSQIQLILDEINSFQISHYYPFYSKDLPVKPEIPERHWMTYKHKELQDEYEEKLKEYNNSKKYEKRAFDGVLAINELFLLLKKKDLFSFTEDYFDKSFNNPKVNEVYYILNYFNLTINEIDNNLNDKTYLKEDLINRLFFLYNTKLSAIVNNNIDNLENDNLLKIEMLKLKMYFSSNKSV